MPQQPQGDGRGDQGVPGAGRADRLGQQDRAIWLTRRQFRAQGAVLFGAIAVLAAALAVTGPQLARRYRADPGRFLSGISGADSALYLVGALAVLAAPVIIGLFWGAPLVTRELDAGTQRLAWTLTTRTRWLAAKLGLTGLAAIAAAACSAWR